MGYKLNALTMDGILDALSKEYRVRVATSDGLEQVIILGGGAMRISAQEFLLEVEAAEKAVREIIEKL